MNTALMDMLVLPSKTPAIDQLSVQDPCKSSCALNQDVRHAGAISHKGLGFLNSCTSAL